ncbi:MAG: hypothetical protein MZV70_63995 [Desulfobacterales bacterium]|nr:hypothetical protein [Desulfobacterales bacterium]
MTPAIAARIENGRKKSQSEAARHGFDWPNTDDVLKKLHEELAELDAARKKGDIKIIEEETGDILFTLVNLSRFLSVDAENALTRHH